MEGQKVLIIGTGAIGSYYGGKLKQAGAHVTALCRSDYNVVKEKGIFIKSHEGDFHFQPDLVIKDAAEYNLSLDFILVTTKVLPEIDIIQIIQPIMKENTSIVLLQNGIDIENKISSSFPHNEIISGLAFICVSRTGPGQVYHQDYGRVVIGKYPSGPSEKVNILNNLFQKSGVNCGVDENIIQSRWKKLVWNAPFNPISVIGGSVNTKEILENEESRLLVKHVMEEVVLLAKKSGYKLPAHIIQKNIDDTMIMTPYKPSMLLDYENKRPMEVEAILGNTVKIARKMDTPVPYLESLYALLLLINEKNLNS